MLPLYLYLASLQYQPPAVSMWQDIIFDMRIDILALKNQHLHMHENILDCYLYINQYLASLQVARYYF